MVKEQDGTDIPRLIIADSAFPLSTWIMKPYGNAVLTQEKKGTLTTGLAGHIWLQKELMVDSREDGESCLRSMRVRKNHS